VDVCYRPINRSAADLQGFSDNRYRLTASRILYAYAAVDASVLRRCAGQVTDAPSVPCGSGRDPLGAGGICVGCAPIERDRISERTREALAIKRAQGVRLGRPSTLPPAIVTRILAEREAGASLRAIADGLTRDGIATAQGGRAWYASTVRKVLASQQAGTVVKHAAR
jgi:hypothetical protein